METRLLLGIVALAACVLVLFNLGGALNLRLPEYDAEISSQPPSPRVKRVSVPFPKVERNQRTIVLIHVGKTGGETVRHTLKITCRMRKNPVQQKICKKSFANKSESALSRHTIGTLHCDLLLPNDCLERATTLLWTLRNPLDRVVSWFQYMNPANCRPLDDYHSTACNTNRSIFATIQNNKKGSKWAVKFFGCFPTINHFADALLDDYASTNSNCSQIARRTISGEASASSGHIHFNHRHYWRETMEKYPSKDIWVLRTEYLWEDMIQVEQLLSNSTDPHRLFEKRNVTHGSEGHAQRDPLSSRGREQLCCTLQNEIAVYGDLLRMSTNLDSEERNRSLDYLAQQCGSALAAASSISNSSEVNCQRSSQ
jgi:hypothetical protein